MVRRFVPKWGIDKPRILKVWCGRRDEAHKRQKKGVRTPLTYIEPVETGRMRRTDIPNDVVVPSVCKKVNVSYTRDGHVSNRKAASFDWEKGRRLWERSNQMYRRSKPLREFGSVGGSPDADPETVEKLKHGIMVAKRQFLDTFGVEPFPGYLRVTCPVCGTVYRLTLYGEVAEWLDEQVGKTRYVSAKHLEKLSLEMMGKNAE